MKAVFLLFISGVLCSSVQSYEVDPPYGVSHSSYPATPVAHGHGHGWGSGHGAGSYYHYHVPLVGQQSHYPPQPQQSNDHHLHYLLPLLLIAALPLLLLPLLPLLLLPLGLSLLALLLPLLMMGGMMMMMMMDGGMMMMMMRNAGVPTRHGYNNAEARSFGNLIYHDFSALLTRYARSLDLDHCPERFACQAGSFLMPSENNGTFEAVTARTLLDFVEQSVPKGKTRQLLRHYKQAFWTGSKTGNCSEFKCSPAFRIPAETPVVQSPLEKNGNASYGSYYNMPSGQKTHGLSNYWDYYSSNGSNYNDNYRNYVNSVNYYATEPSTIVADLEHGKVRKTLRKKPTVFVSSSNSVKYSVEETTKKLS
ncbi:unnamed protein product [Allacma fusca]|uniref:Uncharacterized protein n=1 Tax=Allacma fusca TaxID=39272 RepID=A0A8J2LTD5_9HEXA|nr:unnamed protein product [Allacma fusca]